MQPLLADISFESIKSLIDVKLLSDSEKCLECICILLLLAPRAGRYGKNVISIFFIHIER